VNKSSHITGEDKGFEMKSVTGERVFPCGNNLMALTGTGPAGNPGLYHSRNIPWVCYYDQRRGGLNRPHGGYNVFLRSVKERVSIALRKKIKKLLLFLFQE
jgi:hypothetical protein